MKQTMKRAAPALWGLILSGAIHLGAPALAATPAARTPPAPALAPVPAPAPAPKKSLEKIPKSLFLVKKIKMSPDVGEPQFNPQEAQLRTVINDPVLHNTKKFE